MHEFHIHVVNGIFLWYYEEGHICTKETSIGTIRIKIRILVKFDTYTNVTRYILELIWKLNTK